MAESKGKNFAIGMILVIEILTAVAVIIVVRKLFGSDGLVNQVKMIMGAG